MKPLFLLLVAFAAAVGFAHFSATDSGFVIIGYQGKVLTTTFTFFVIVLISATIAAILLVRFLRGVFGLQQRLRRWGEAQRLKRAHHALGNGLLALASGEFAKAERLLSKSADGDYLPEVHYLAAAEAAQAQRATARRNSYLRLADTSDEAGIALDIKRLQWAIENREFDEARDLILSLKRSAPGNLQALKLELELYREADEPQSILEVAPMLRRDRVISHDETIAMENQAAATLIKRADDIDMLQDTWNGLPKSVRAHPQVLATHCRRLDNFGRANDAEALLRKALDRRLEGGLVEAYGDVNCEVPVKQLRKVEAWRVSHPDRSDLKEAQAKLALRAGLWQQARELLGELIDQQPLPLRYELLADAYEQLDMVDQAHESRRAGLAMATAGATS
ncbi:MAG: heme biosynthesis HemY N-terminal domain-containing protein [Pseudomonadota bacterium]